MLNPSLTIAAGNRDMKIKNQVPDFMPLKKRPYGRDLHLGY
jgi:hypothetical protein